MTDMTSAQEAINIAGEFIEPHYPWYRPIKAASENGVWIVEFDVGAIKTEVATVRIDASTREITEFIKAPPSP